MTVTHGRIRYRVLSAIFCLHQVFVGLILVQLCGGRLRFQHHFRFAFISRLRQNRNRSKCLELFFQ